MHRHHDPKRAKRDELLEEAIDEAASYIGKVLDLIVDKAEPSVPKRRPLCKRPDCRRYYNTNLWLMVITPAGERSTIKLPLCQTHALEAHEAHQAGKLADYGNAIILKTHVTRWQGK